MNIISRTLHVSAQRDLRVRIVCPLILGLFRRPHTRVECPFKQNLAVVLRAAASTALAWESGRLAGWHGWRPHGPSRLCVPCSSGCRCHLRLSAHPNLRSIAKTSSSSSISKLSTRSMPPSPPTFETNETRSLRGAKRPQKSKGRQEPFWPKSKFWWRAPSARQ